MFCKFNVLNVCLLNVYTEPRLAYEVHPESQTAKNKHDTPQAAFSTSICHYTTQTTTPCRWTVDLWLLIKVRVRP